MEIRYGLRYIAGRPQVRLCLQIGRLTIPLAPWRRMRRTEAARFGCLTPDLFP